MQIETYYFRAVMLGGIKTQLLELTDEKISVSENDIYFKDVTDFSILFFHKRISASPRIEYWSIELNLWLENQKKPILIEMDESLPNKMNFDQLRELYKIVFNQVWNKLGIRLYNQMRDKLNRDEEILINDKLMLTKDSIKVKKGFLRKEWIEYKLIDIYFEKYNEAWYFIKSKQSKKEIKDFRMSQKNSLLYKTYIEFCSKQTT